MKIEIPYGKDSLSLDIGEVDCDQYIPRITAKPLGDFTSELKSGLEQPYPNCSFEELCSGKKQACVVVDDHTRPPSGRMVLGPLIDRLHECGLEEIVVIIALGLHTPLDETQKYELLGDLPDNVRVVNHDPEGDLVEVGEVQGRPVWINRLFVNAPFKIVIGDVELHQIFGYGGGMKSILPGIADRDSITHTHSLLTEQHSGPGILGGNPVQQFLNSLREEITVDLSIQLIMDAEEKPVKILTGSMEDTFNRGVELIDQMYKMPAGEPVDTLIVSPGGYPRDVDLYQAQKALNMNQAIQRNNTRIIMFAECREGPGSEEFIEWLDKGMSRSEVEEEVGKRFSMGLHKMYLFHHCTRGREVYLYSSLEDDDVRKAFMQPVNMEAVENVLKSSKRIGFVPYATTTLIERREV
jgi:nickel-dependent lactate racemase